MKFFLLLTGIVVIISKCSIDIVFGGSLGRFRSRSLSALGDYFKTAESTLESKVNREELEIKRGVVQHGNLHQPEIQTVLLLTAKVKDGLVQSVSASVRPSTTTWIDLLNEVKSNHPVVPPVMRSFRFFDEFGDPIDESRMLIDGVESMKDLVPVVKLFYLVTKPSTVEVFNTAIADEGVRRYKQANQHKTGPSIAGGGIFYKLDIMKLKVTEGEKYTWVQDPDFLSVPLPNFGHFEVVEYLSKLTNWGKTHPLDALFKSPQHLNDPVDFSPIKHKNLKFWMTLFDPLEGKKRIRYYTAPKPPKPPLPYIP